MKEELAAPDILGEDTITDFINAKTVEGKSEATLAFFRGNLSRLRLVA